MKKYSVARDGEARVFTPGMGTAVAERTILRKKPNNTWETWADVADRVAKGNSLLSPITEERELEYQLLRKHLRKATTLLSGRQLQHGDENQPTRNMEVYSNCSTAPTSFLSFLLLLNGSGVGRCYDDDMMLVDWSLAPNVRCVLSDSHPDFNYSAHESVRDAHHKYGKGKGKSAIWYTVEDSREGWAKALEIWEVAAFEKIHHDKLFIFDFSDIRPAGTPIMGMQGRPASGPVPIMNAFAKASSLKGANLDPYKSAMYLDHLFAEIVLVGGVRRSARMSTKIWTDANVLEFITIKRPIEYQGLSLSAIAELHEGYKAKGQPLPQSFLWSSNNSVMVDADFWRRIDLTRSDDEFDDELTQHAKKVFKVLTETSFVSGEPGIINADRLVRKNDGWEDLNRGDYVDSDKFHINEDTTLYLARLAKRAKKKKYNHITNPCGEITLNLLGSYCILADCVPFHAESLEEAEEAIRASTRALIRVNCMNSLYEPEVRRTNRIGVSLTGVHEFAWKFFKYGFRDLINEQKSKDFWLTLARFSRAVQEEAIQYSAKLGVKTPHTMLTVKPSGSVSKLFGLTEGWHLPAMEYYLRNVQYRNSDPLIDEYRVKGYPVRQLERYANHTIVGFPTKPAIADLGMPEVVTAGEATPEEQYQWLALGEKYWLRGTDEDGGLLLDDYSNQISYTLKYDPSKVDFKHFRDLLRTHQSQIKCCSIMPQESTSSYEYFPEQPISRVEFEQLSDQIKKNGMAEDIGREHIDCATGACPIEFRVDK